MTDDDDPPAAFRCRRWSRRKLEAARARPRRNAAARRPIPRIAAVPSTARLPVAAAPPAAPRAADGRRDHALPPRRVADLRLRFHARSCSRRSTRPLKRAGAEEAVPRSALQRDGRARRLHRRLLEAGSDLARDGAAAAAQQSHLRAAEDAGQRRRATSRTFRRTSGAPPAAPALPPPDDADAAVAALSAPDGRRGAIRRARRQRSRCHRDHRARPNR